MRFDFTGLREAISQHALNGAKTLVAAGGVTLAAGTVLYAAWPNAEEPRIDAVVDADAPVFRPASVALAPRPVPAMRPSNADLRYAVDQRDPASVTRAVQRSLRQAGCYDGAVNGRWTAGTRRAMAAFTEIVNARLPVDRPDPVLLALLQNNADASCTAARNAAVSGEVASIDRHDSDNIETGRAEVERVERVAPPPLERREIEIDRPSAATPDDERAEPRLAEIEEGTPDAEGSMTDEAALAAASAAAAAKVATSDRPRAKKRKYRKRNSFSRNLRKLERSMRRIFF